MIRARLLQGIVMSASLAWAIASPAAPASTPYQPTATDLHREITTILDTPEFATEETVHRWQWRGRAEERPAEARDSQNAFDAFMRWLTAFANWVASALEAVLWATAIVALILIYLRRDRWLPLLAQLSRADRYVPPSRVSGLDIRPEHLPDDIVAAAREAWERGDVSSAMSLLYRGALSRLVHERRLPLPGSATEGDCVRIVGRDCGGALAEYFGVLTRSWQFVAYAGRPPSADGVHWLFEHFDQHFRPVRAP